MIYELTIILLLLCLPFQTIHLDINSSLIQSDSLLSFYYISCQLMSHTFSYPQYSKSFSKYCAKCLKFLRENEYLT